MADRLWIDVNDALRVQCPEGGLEPKELEALEGRARSVHADLFARQKRGELGFFDLPYERSAANSCIELGKRLSGWAENVVVMGIGGSSLGPRALYAALAPAFHHELPASQRGGARLYFPDNSDPVTFHALLEMLDLSRTAFLAITKSGGTAETWAQLLVLRERLAQEGLPFARHVVAITDPEKGALRALVKEEKLESLPVPPGVGGRFSVLTPVGLVPAAAAGLDVEELLEGARDMAERCKAEELAKNPAYLLGAVLYLLDTAHGRGVHVLMPYCDALRELGAWYVQLWAESLGKSPQVGPTPLGAVGATDQHSLLQELMQGPHNKVVAFVEVGRPRSDLPIPRLLSHLSEATYLGGHTLNELLLAERKATAAALTHAGRPSLTLGIPEVDARHVGELLFLWEMATAFAGGLYGIDPFNQPGVEAGKRYASGLLGRKGYEEARQEIESRPARDPRWMLA